MRTQVTNSVRRTIWETLLLRSNNGVLSHGQQKEVAEVFCVERRVVSRIWERGTSSMGVRIASIVDSRAHLRGGKKKDRRQLCEKIRAMDVRDRTNYRAIQHATGASAYMIRQLYVEGFLRRAFMHTRPLLTDKHREERVKFCAKHVVENEDGGYEFVDMYNVVHVDEKWFYVKKIGSKVYVLTGEDGLPLEEPPVQFVQSKRFIMKVMFLCAVARPRGDWDGKLGIWPVVEPYVTKRASVNRPAGVIEMRPVSIDRPKSREMMLTQVIPAIKAQWPVHQRGMDILIQQDNATPHISPDDPAVYEAGHADGWSISISLQPAQSPDLNVLDLGFFNSIQSLQSYTVPRTMDDLVLEVKKAFAATTAFALNKTFLTLQYVMEQVMKHGGRNDFRLGHLKKESLIRTNSLPTTLTCDSLVYTSAINPNRTLPHSDLDYLGG